MIQLLIIQLFINLRISSHKCSIDVHVEVRWKRWRLAHKTLSCCLSSLDCQNMGQIAWLNFPNRGFQAPALVRPLAAWVSTFLLRDILSWACLLGEQGKKEGKPRMLSCTLTQTPGFLCCRGQCVEQEAACAPPHNFSAWSQGTSSEHLCTAFKGSCSLSLNQLSPLGDFP